MNPNCFSSWVFTYLGYRCFIKWLDFSSDSLFFSFVFVLWNFCAIMLWLYLMPPQLFPEPSSLSLSTWLCDFFLQFLQIQPVLLVHSQMCGFLLECSQPTRGYILKENPPSPSSYQLPVASGGLGLHLTISPSHAGVVSVLRLYRCWALPSQLWVHKFSSYAVTTSHCVL